MAKSDGVKLLIASELQKKPSTVNELSEICKINAKMTRYFLIKMIKSGHVTRDDSVHANMIYSITDKKYDIMTEKKSYITYPQPHIMVVMNSKKKSNEFPAERKKRSSHPYGGMQSGMQSWDF